MAHFSTIAFLKDFYSIGQLQIILSTLTDKGAIPGMGEKERTERVEAIRHILGSVEPVVTTKPIEPMPELQSETPKMKLAKAERLANDLVFQLQDYCEKIHIAGSIRREKPEVKDIEIVCQAKTFVAGGGGLFDEGTRFYEIIPAFRREVESLGRIIKGKPDGRYMQIALPSGINLDLFMPVPPDFYRQVAIRTGSADYSAKVIATGWKKKGWCGTSDGLRLIADCKETPSGWKCVTANPELPPVFESEKHFFDWLGIPWIEPKFRTI